MQPLHDTGADRGSGLRSRSLDGPADASTAPRRILLSAGLWVRFVLWLTSVALILALAAATIHHREASAEAKFHTYAAARIVDRATEIIERDLDAVRSDLLFLAGQARLRDALAGRPGADTRLAAEYVSFSRHRRIYDQVRILDATGRERIRVNHNDGIPRVVDGTSLQSKAERSYFRQAVAQAPGSIYVSAFDLNVEQGQIERPLKPVIRFATAVELPGCEPAREGSDEAGKCPQGGEASARGVLVLNYLGRSLLRRIARAPAGAGFAGKVLLLNGEGDYLLNPASKESEWGFRLGTGRSFAADHPAVWQRIASASRGTLVGGAGLYAHHTLRGRRHPEVGLIVLAHVPPERLGFFASRLLGRIALLYGVVAIPLAALLFYLSWAGEVRRRNERWIERSEARLRALSLELLDAQERERKSVSRDLHDDLGQVVTAVRLALDGAAKAPDGADRAVRIDEARTGLDVLLERIREISARLRPSVLDDVGLAEAVRLLVRDFESRSGIAARADLRLEGVVLPAGFNENLYRIVQEALTNVARHSEASEVRVEMRARDERIEIAIHDDGVGFRTDFEASGSEPAHASGGLGLTGMRERVALLGGRLEVSSSPGEGTEIRAVIGLPPPAGPAPRT